jgi:2-dehydropantoate 2-reductase
MRFLIIGAGAIGGSAGAYLVRGGQEVVLVEADAAHVHAMQTNGLTLEGRLDFTVPVRATLPGDMAAALDGQPPEAVILAVKSQHTQMALTPLVPLLGPDSFVLSMQNGLNPHEVVRQIGAGRTVASFVNSMGTDYLSPGRIMYGGPGTMFIGELDGQMTPRVDRLVEVMRSCFVENTQATANIWGYLWGKEGFGAMLFAGAVMDISIADLMADRDSRRMLADIAGEVVRVADAEGISCEPFDGYDPTAMRLAKPRDWDTIDRSLALLEQRYRQSLKPKSGIWRDLVVRRRPTEVDAQLGIVSTLAQRHGIAVPLIDRVVTMIHEIENGTRTMDHANLEELRELDRRAYPDA